MTDFFDGFLDTETKEPEFPWDKEQAVAAPVEKPMDTPAVIVGEDGEYETSLSTFSNSKLDCFTKCPWFFKLKYVDGHREPKGANLVFGGAVHRGAEAAAREIMKNGFGKGTPMGKKLGEDAFKTYFSKEIKDAELKKTESADAMLDQGITMIRLIYDDYLVKTPICYVEQKVEKEVVGLGKVVGIIDVVEGQMSSPDGAIINPAITDYKTSRTVYDDDAILRSPQLGLYSIIRGISRVKYIIPLKHKKVELQKLEHVYTNAEKQFLLGVMVQTWNIIKDAIASGDESKFFPAKLTGWGSPCGNCNFKSLCEKTLHDVGKKYFTAK